MHTVAGLIGVNLAFVPAGGALLYALGLVRTRWRPALFLAVGPAYFCGVALVMPLLIALLVIGVHLTLVTLVVVSLVAAAVLAGIGTRVQPREEDASAVPASSQLELWATRVGLAALAIWLVVAAFAFTDLPTSGDDFRVWSLRAVGLYYFGHLQPGLFTGSPAIFPHLDYPLLQPSLEALVYHGLGRVDLTLIHIELWILFVGFLWTVAFLLAPRRRPLLWLPVVAALAVAPGAYSWIRIGYADTTVASFVATGALCLGLWLESRRTRYALLGGMMLAAAANTKSEGLAFSVMVLVAVALVLVVPRDWPALRWLVAAGAVFVAGVLPWRLWLHGHVPPVADVPSLTTSLKYHYLSSRISRLGVARQAVFDRIQNQGVWVWLGPSFLVAAITALVAGTVRRVASFYLVAVAGITIALLYAYWTSPADIRWYLTYSVDRTVSAILFVAAMGVAQLTSALGARERT